MRVTKKTVEDFLTKHFPGFAAWENPVNGDKGTYQKSVGQAFSFRTEGQTWREVLEALQRQLEESA